MRDIDVLIIGGGVCGVLAGARFAREGFSYKIIEKNHDYGGVWAYRANGYSHLQAHAALYEWDLNYRLDKFPFHKCPGSTVLRTLRAYASDCKLRDHTAFNASVIGIKQKDDGYMSIYADSSTGAQSQVQSKAVFVCCGILGKQYSICDRYLKNVEAYTGLSMFAGKQGDAVNHLENMQARDKDVVILGSGAFGLEAMEAACRSRAKSITLVTKDRDRNCGLNHMAPAPSTPQLFTGQCNDAFFQYAKQGKAKYIIGEVANFKDKEVHLKSGAVLCADILVTALGHELQKAPAFLEGLGVGFTTDLHNFAFLGKNPKLGCASDWVWFNVPHGPLKQIDSFVAGLKACQDGQEEAMRKNLLPTPFVGCKGEPLNHKFASGMKERQRAYWRTLSAGLPWHKALLLWARLKVQEMQVWLLCCGMFLYESVALLHWLDLPKSKASKIA